MPRREYHVKEYNRAGVSGDDLVYLNEDPRNVVLETVTLRAVTVTENFTPVLIYKDTGGDLIAAATSPGSLNPGVSSPKYVSWAVGGAEHDGPVAIQGTLPLITLSLGFTFEIILYGASNPENQVFDLRATTLG